MKWLMLTTKSDDGHDMAVKARKIGDVTGMCVCVEVNVSTQLFVS